MKLPYFLQGKPREAPREDPKLDLSRVVNYSNSIQGELAIPPDVVPELLEIIVNCTRQPVRQTGKHGGYNFGAYVNTFPAFAVDPDALLMLAAKEGEVQNVKPQLRDTFKTQSWVWKASDQESFDAAPIPDYNHVLLLIKERGLKVSQGIQATLEDAAATKSKVWKNRAGIVLLHDPTKNEAFVYGMSVRPNGDLACVETYPYGYSMFSDAYAIKRIRDLGLPTDQFEKLVKQFNPVFYFGASETVGLATAWARNKDSRGYQPSPDFAVPVNLQRAATASEIASGMLKANPAEIKIGFLRGGRAIEQLDAKTERVMTSPEAMETWRKIFPERFNPDDEPQSS